MAHEFSLITGASSGIGATYVERLETLTTRLGPNLSHRHAAGRFKVAA